MGEIELISDGDGIAVLGSSKDVERFLKSEGLVSRHLTAEKLAPVLGTGATAANAASVFAAESGRWVKLTADSAAAVKKHGLTPTTTPGVSHAMIGERGDIKRWLQITGRPAMLATPAGLAVVATMMQQQAMQQQMQAITEYLAVIDEKVDDILRAQKDAVLAGMIGVGLVIEEAMTVRDEVGRVSEVTWSKVQGSTATIAKTQAYALRQLDAITEKLEGRADMGGLAKEAKRAETQVQEWLGVLARCIQLQDGVAVLELDRVLDASPDEINRHRLGLTKARQNRVEAITRSSERLIERMTDAANRANTRVLLNPHQSPAVVKASNVVVTDVCEFHERLGIESASGSSDPKRWRTAAFEARDRAFDSSAEGVARASEVTGKFFNSIAERARRRRTSEPQVEENGEPEHAAD